MAAGIALSLMTMILGACVCACKITMTEGMGCFPSSRKYDQVVTLDEDSDGSENEGTEGVELIVTMNKSRE